jgi:hypothetical protein
MPRCWKWLAALLVAVWWQSGASLGHAGVPDVTQSFYVPQSGTVATPTEGAIAARNFRICPNNDGGSSLPGNARVKVVVRDVNGMPIVGIAPADICLLFNGGLIAQGFSGVGADSIVANSVLNYSPLCPDVRCVAADAPTDVSGTTYITFAGADQANPGVTLRNANRKWGHYDSEIPVYVLGFKIQGRLTTASANGTYVLRIKNIDITGGTTAPPGPPPPYNVGEAVAFADYSSVVTGITTPGALSYWRDLNGDGTVSASDVFIVTAHYLHDCDTPNP